MRKKSSPTSAAESAPAENVPHQPRAHVCHRCGDAIAPDTDREHGPQGVSHHLATCFENVKAERDQSREDFARIMSADRSTEKKAAKK